MATPGDHSEQSDGNHIPVNFEGPVKSATHRRWGASGRKLRLTRSFARLAAGSAMVMRLTLPRRAPCRPQVPQKPLHRAAGHVDAHSAQLQPHFPGTIGPVIVVVLRDDDPFQGLIPQRPRRRRAGSRLVIAGRGEFAAQLSELGANRLDPVLVLVPVDELDDQRCGRSSSAAKKAEAAFRISFARRNSLFSAFSFRSSADSSPVTPGRCPASTSAFRTQL